MKLVLEREITATTTAIEAVDDMLKFLESFKAVIPDKALLAGTLDRNPDAQYRIIAEGAPDGTDISVLDGKVNGRLAILRAPFDKRQLSAAAEDARLMLSEGPQFEIFKMIKKLAEGLGETDH